MVVNSIITNHIDYRFKIHEKNNIINCEIILKYNKRKKQTPSR